ncbi:MAG: hypothetical protein ACT4QA_04475 [Panacagrimonas sp.]
MLAAAHTVGVLHKALKPANVLIAPRSQDQSHHATLTALRTLGAIDLQAGNPALALARIGPARAGLDKLLGTDAPDVQAASWLLARALHASGRDAEALPLLESLDPAKLGIALGGSGWQERLEVLRGRSRSQ